MIDFGAVHIRLGMLKEDRRTLSLQILVSAVNIEYIFDLILFSVWIFFIPLND